MNITVSIIICSFLVSISSIGVAYKIHKNQLDCIPPKFIDNPKVKYIIYVLNGEKFNVIEMRSTKNNVMFKDEKGNLYSVNKTSIIYIKENVK